MTSREDWIGRTGLEWSRHSEAMEGMLGPAGQAGLDALAPQAGENILDLGCGAGASTAALAAAVGSAGNVFGVDVSPDLILAARSRLSNLPQADLIEADATTHAFQPAGYDAVFSRFGSMFFEDPAAAFANVRGALKAGARAVMVAWREPAQNQWATVPMSFVAEGLADPRSAPGPSPFSWADPDVFREQLTAGGFESVSATHYDFMAAVSLGEDPDPVRRAIALMMRIGPLAARLRGAPEEAKREAEAFLTARLARHVHQGVVRLPASAWIVSAEA
ncbi:MAG: methyltransferase domain-containing protein [Pseudomonadota bacterium]